MEAALKEEILTVDGAHGIIWKSKKTYSGDADNKKSE